VQWRRDLGTDCSSVAEIAKRYPREALIVSVSTEYLEALEDDLVSASEAVKERGSLMVISAGGQKKGRLEPNFLPCDSRLEHQFGRSRMALNVRTLESVLHQHVLGGIPIEAVRGHFERLLRGLPPADYPKREKGSDDQVYGFIERSLSQRPN
jgi:hypothetical protein